MVWLDSLCHTRVSNANKKEFGHCGIKTLCSLSRLAFKIMHFFVVASCVLQANKCVHASGILTLQQCNSGVVCACVCKRTNCVPYGNFSGCVPIYPNSFVIIIVSVVLFWCSENEMKCEIKIDQANSHSHFPYCITFCMLVFSSLLLL